MAWLAVYLTSLTLLDRETYVGNLRGAEKLPRRGISI